MGFKAPLTIEFDNRIFKSFIQYPRLTSAGKGFPVPMSNVQYKHCMGPHPAHRTVESPEPFLNQ